MANRNFLIITLAVMVTSCSSIGPSTIERDQMDYGVSIHESVKQQLLGNIVRLRYIEAPIFVNVSSVINQYALSGNVQAGVGFNNSFTGGDSGSIGAGGTWEDRPTVTYSPITGREFSESLLTPIPPEALFALVQSGWPADLMFRLTVASMNGVEDANNGRQADPEFRELLGAWTRLRDARVIGLRRSDGAAGQKARIVVYVNQTNMSDTTNADLALIRKVLGLRSGSEEYKLSYGLIPDEPDEIVVLTMSILDIMVNLASEVDVPDKHVEEGRTRPTFVDEGLGGALFRVHVAKDKPDDAYTAIFNRGYWFYIDDRDMISKRTFGVLQILLSLTDSGDEARGPVVTIGG